MNSREKVLALRQRLQELKPEDESTAQMLQVLTAISPLLARALPENPEEVDGYLRMMAWGSAQCRSDGAPPLGVFELVNGAWRPVKLEEEG